jgi:hypothetical protein
MFNNQIIAGSSGQGGFEIEQSLKFNDDESQYLSWTPASAGNRKTMTFSFWFKIGNLDTNKIFYGYWANATAYNSFIYIDNVTNGGKIRIYDNTGSTVFDLITSQYFRDPSAWYHLVLSIDTTQATASNRIKLYINGEQITAFDTASYPSQNADCTVFNNSVLQYIGYAPPFGGGSYMDGYLADFNFIDGTALDPTSFGQFTNGYWEKKDYAGSYGSNGFHLTFKDDIVSEGFNTVTYRGTGATQSVSGLGLSPDLVWIKDRTTAYDHHLFDTVRGGGNSLYSNDTVVENTYATDITFDADGFTVADGSTTPQIYINRSGDSFVAWAWDAGTGSPASNTQGSITSTVKANPSYGFSIASYVGTGANATVGHGLSSAPEMIIVKNRTSALGWLVYHSSTGPTKFTSLSDTNPAQTASTVWQDTAPTSSVFSIGTSTYLNTSGNNIIAYCFHSVSGYSSIGSYTGNGSTSGPTVTTGFRPAFVMVKRTDYAADWLIIDNTRSPTNYVDDYLSANSSAAEQSNIGAGNSITWLSDGFQITGNWTSINDNGGTYIYMAFADTREYAFWKDVSGNGNNWTPNNLDYRDSLPDTPTNNFATMNSLDAQLFSFAEGNLKVSCASTSYGTGRSSIAVDSGKWYWEVQINEQVGADVRFMLGIEAVNIALPSFVGYTDSNGYGYYYASGDLYYNNVLTSGNATYTLGDVIGMALDLDAGTLSYYKNGTLQPQSFSSISGTFTPAMSLRRYSGTACAAICNFGQDSTFAGAKPMGAYTDASGYGTFQHQPPAGFKSLCTANLTTPTIIDGSEHFNTVLYVGDYSTSNSITGVGFSPDFVWIKDRGLTTVYNYSHALFDTVRGAGKWISTNRTDAENDFGTGTTSPFRSFDADGFTVGQNYNTNEVDPVADYFVSWNWKAGGTAVSNTSGSITSQVSANIDMGFSVVSYTGTGSNATVGHGLSTAPSMIITKVRSGVSYWLTYHSGLGSPSTSYMALNTTDAVDTGGASVWNSTAPTSSVFSVGTSTWINPSGGDMIAYCFANSDIIKVGSYTGNGSTDGPFVYTGFRPAWVMVKNASLAATSWLIWDDERSTYNIANDILKAQSANAEVVNNNSFGIDVLSNGFKVRSSYGDVNQSGNTVIYLAIAETPLKYATAR